MADAALVVTVRLLCDAYNGTGDWPPAPARLFQALVAGAARGKHIEEADRAALLWLERQAPPRIAAPVAVPIAAPVLFVPNNDLDAKGGDPARVAEVRVAKRTERRRIDRPAPILYVFDVAQAPPPALAELAERLFRLGRGDDPAFATVEVVDMAEADRRLAHHPGILHVPCGGGAVPVAIPGTLESLERRFAMTLGRFVVEGAGKRARTVFVQPAKPLFGRIGYDTPPRRLGFEILDGERFAPVPLRRAGALVDGLRKAAAERLGRAGVASADRLLVGRGAGQGDLARRIVVLPLPSIGHAETDPSIRRVTILVPAVTPIPAPDVAWAFAGLVPADPATGEVLCDGRLVPATEQGMERRYDGPARRWRSITPLALGVGRRRIPPDAAPADVKPGGELRAEHEAAAEAVRVACAQAGIRAAPVAVAVQREPFGRREAMAEMFASGTRFGKHALWHADVAFDRPVAGPLLLGDGRFAGLGLMRPVAGVPGGWALHADRPLPDASELLGAALRRAVMAQARDRTGDVAPFFSGHDEDGTPLRDGGRRHVATLADPARQRFLLLAPHLLDRRVPAAGERRHLAELGAIAERLTALVAGRLGAFRLTAAPLDADDPLIGPARVWESLSPYVLTRHPRRVPAASLVAEDVAVECRRRGLPLPAAKVLGERRGLAFTLRLDFGHAVEGPVVLGRTGSRGGLFAPVSR